MRHGCDRGGERLGHNGLSTHPRGKMPAMRPPARRLFTLRSAASLAAVVAVLAAARAAGPAGRAFDSPSGLKYYAQGGVVVDGVAYFTADDHFQRLHVPTPDGFPSVVAFDVAGFRKRTTYPVGRTYDSSPMVLRRKDGTWLVVAHEHERARTVAVDRDTGKVEWVSPANQPGSYFFGYTYYELPDGSKVILQAAANGLHALSAETGRELWAVPARASGGVTPCVDQRRGWVFYQSNGKVWKLDARDGRVLATAAVPAPSACVSWATVLAEDDARGYAVATRWYGKPEWDTAVRVYDQDLRLRWERTGLPGGKKDVLTYAEGKLVAGVGNGWGRYAGDAWKAVVAHRIGDGEVAWRCDLKEYDFVAIPNAPYFHGHFYAESEGPRPHVSRIFRIRASDGALREVLDTGEVVASCAPAIIAAGRLFSGDRLGDRIVVTELARGATGDWPGAFCDPQRHTYAVPAEPGVTLVPMRTLAAP